MAARLRAKHQEEVRTKIQTSQLINRLQDHALGDAELSPTRIKAIEVLLKKTLPDLSATEISGDPEAPLETRLEVKLVKADGATG
jgi:hypothetical protein